MRTVILTFCLALLALAPPALAGVEICDDINDLADGWSDIADALEVDADEDVGELDLRRLVGDVNALLPASEDLGDFLIDIGNRRERRMGNDLLDLVDELYDVTDDDFTAYLVDRIDDLVDCMDYITDYCDRIHD